MRSFILLCLFIYFTNPGFAQARHYVNQNASGGAQTGATWTDAFTDLQQALSAAAAGDSIWVAAGAYKPTNTTNRTVSFVLKDGVALFGGFAGNETDLSFRNFNLNKTILSGDIGVPGQPADNAHHVVRGKGLGSATVLDGFTIRDGYSYDQFTPVQLDRYGAGMLLEGSNNLTDSRPVIQNCVFEHNHANNGGGLCATWSDFGNPEQFVGTVNPVLRNCTFSRNTASSQGGAFYKNSPSAPSDTFVLEDCKFLDNKAYIGKGGGIYFDATANSSTVIRRCVFERDSSFGDAGGAVAYYASPPDLSTYTLLFDSCAFRGNMALEGGAFLFDGYTGFVQGEGLALNCKMLNCLFEENLARFIDGSAYYFFLGFNAKIDIEVEDCVFVGNLANDITAHISFFQNNESHLKVNRCLFYGNKDPNGPNRLCLTFNHGGGAFNVTTTEITNCVFFDNGGGVAATSGARNQSTTRIANCTFFDNNEYIFVKTWDPIFNDSTQYFNDFFIDNCIIWEPGTDLRKMFYNNEPMVSNMYGYRLNNTLLNLTDSTSVPGAAQAFQSNILRGIPPGFQDSLAGDLRLLPCSPAVNKGNNDIPLGMGLQDDLDGLPRIQYGKVDLGAYEQQDSCESVSTTAAPGTLPLSLWPNPSLDEYLHFQVPLAEGSIGTLMVFDAHGRMVFQKEIIVFPTNTVHLDLLQAGFYIVHLRTSEGEFAGKWVRLR
ncbi:MAG: T9SS type A sorting domain-containing protein [Saprospiraceae bacterium]|nr:T9SS type A sorting domain-containing protein [Saprospiraceae bacterium]